MNPERLIGDAKALALSLVNGYAAPSPRLRCRWAANAAYALLKLGVWTAEQGAFHHAITTRLSERSWRTS